MKPAFVIVVSGTSGGGKSTLVQKVAELLGDAVRLHFDDFVKLANDPAQIRAWLEEGGSPEAIQTPELAQALARLSSGEAVEVPGGRGLLEPAPYLVLEEPFGRSRSELAPLIDFAAHLDIPPEIALARRIVRTIEAPERAPDDRLLADLHQDLRGFLLVGREAYQAAERAARGAADLVLDGLEPPQELAELVVAEILRRRP